MREQYLKLALEKQQLLLPLRQVQIILRLPTLYAVPSQTKGFEGVLNYHGMSVPVYNLGDCLGSETVEKALDTPLILCELEAGTVGILVSDVEEVIHLSTDEIQQSELSKLPDFVAGTYVSEKASMWVISLETLIDPKKHLESVVGDES